jgi:RHS repeat-associated protein
MITAQSNHLILCDRSNSVLLRPSATCARSTTYSAFGYCTTPQQEHTSLGFNGQLQERNRTYLLGSYRAYLPWLKRFASPDRISPFGNGGLNAYAYCNGDPVNRTDPSGHESQSFDIGSALLIGLGAISLMASGRMLLAKSLSGNPALKRSVRKQAGLMATGGAVTIGIGVAATLMPKDSEWVMMRAILLGAGGLALAGSVYRGYKGWQKTGGVSGAAGRVESVTKGVPSPRPSVSSNTSSRQGSPSGAASNAIDGAQQRTMTTAHPDLERKKLVARRNLGRPPRSNSSADPLPLLSEHNLSRLEALRKAK